MHSHCRQSQKALSARTKESRREHCEAGCNGRVPRRVTAAALARSCMVRKVMLAETHAEGRRLERTPPIDARPVNGGARRIDRWSWPKRQVRGIDDDVFVVRIREHYRRDKCLITEVVRENVRQVCDRVVGRPCRYRETVRSEMAIPSFNNSPWIRGAPQRQFSAAIRRIRSRQGESMRGLPGRRERRRQHRRTLRDANDRQWLAGSAPALPATGATTTAKTAKTDGQPGQKRLFERARTPSWWRRARVSSRRSRRVARADRTAAPVR